MKNKKVVEIEERIPTLKERRRLRSNRWLIIYVSLFFLLMTVIIYFQTSFSHIKAVEVDGNAFVSDEWIIKQTGLLNDVSMWFFDEDAAVNEVSSHPEIRTVTLSRKWPNTVLLHVEEYERIGYVEAGGSFFPLLETGDMLTAEETAVNAPFDAPILYGFDDEKVTVELAKELTQVSESIRMGMSEIHLSPADNDPLKIIVYMNDGFVVHSTVRRFAERIAPYPSVVEQLDANVEGILHMRINPYFERFETEEEEEGESEG
ncbi:cell division protein FtsQ [Evansella caseinilytica]|uniref:Cell division protein DivIB n=1 Tax=Evansella caseinilytica TaxID=1503961 RepID=A0A1H3MH03_9BACI|nr:FtsQ-type POTRA domain-containing protein [Evansella caseinilytica]SDY75931.1 cell division protein FtsQ [Evansella caseinilytica]